MLRKKIKMRGKIIFSKYYLIHQAGCTLIYLDEMTINRNIKNLKMWMN